MGYAFKRNFQNFFGDYCTKNPSFICGLIDHIGMLFIGLIVLFFFAFFIIFVIGFIKKRKSFTKKEISVGLFCLFFPIDIILFVISDIMPEYELFSPINIILIGLTILTGYIAFKDEKEPENKEIEDK